MTQPQFADGPPVPLMTDGTLDAAGLNRLVSDLRAHATILSVREKAAPGAYAANAEQPLEPAFARLSIGVTRAVQVRYRYDGHEWTDTVFVLSAGFRVVRCRHEP